MSGEGDLRARVERASRVFGWQHLARYSGQSQEWLERTLTAMVREALATPAEPARESDGVGLREDEREALHKANSYGGGYMLDIAVEKLIATRVTEARARALEEAADEMEFVIAEGDVAEVAAPVQGERGRGAVVARRDALYEEPHTWLRDRARGLRGDQ